MGPSVKFVSRTNGSFSKKILVNFFSRKKGQTGRGGSEGGLSKWHNFSVFFFFETLTLYELYSIDRFFCLSLQYISKYNSVFTHQVLRDKEMVKSEKRRKLVKRNLTWFWLLPSSLDQAQIGSRGKTSKQRHLILNIYLNIF